MPEWRYLFFELNGDGTERFLRGDVPVANPQPIRKLSTPHQITGTLVAGKASDLVAFDGSTILRRWKTTVYVADENDRIWVGGVLADYDIEGPNLSFDVAGFTAYPKGQPFDGEINAVQEDPLELTRTLWSHVQSQPGGNLGLTLESTTSPVRIGAPPRQVSFEASDGRAPKVRAAETISNKLKTADAVFDDWTWIDAPTYVKDHGPALASEYGGNTQDREPATIWLTKYVADHKDDPYGVEFDANDGAIKLNWWSTSDIAGQVDKWAQETPFDYLEEHVFNGDVVEHHLRLGYPSIGALKPHLRFVLGENVDILPGENYDGDDVVTEVWVFGAGEGRTRIRAVASVPPTDSLRRVKIVDDKGIDNPTDAQTRARNELMRYQPDVPGAGVTQLRVKNHSNAEFGTFDVGDVVPYSGAHNWGDVVIWIKILTMTLLPGGKLQLAVVRADTMIS